MSNRSTKDRVPASGDTFSLGLIVSIPFTACVLVEAYADIFGVRGRTPGRSTAQGPGPGEAPAPVSAS